MRLLIHAVAARMGGARTHLLGLVPELAALAERDDRFLLLAQPDLLTALPALPETWELRPEDLTDRGWAGRLLWEQVRLRQIASAWRADALLSFGSFLPLRAPCATVLEAANALPFTRAYWSLLQREPLRVQLAESARWHLLSASLWSATRILAPTRGMRQDVVVRLPHLLEKVDVVPWGVSDRFRQFTWRPPAEPRIVGVSKHAVSKEFDVLVSALPRLLDRWPRARLVLTGRPDESRWSRATADLVARLGLEACVDWAGDLPNEGVAELMAGASVVVFPTWCESFGLPLAEAQVVGVPAVAGDIPACREVGGDAARYYHPGSAASLADEVARLLGDPAAAADLSARGRARGDRFRWRANAEGTRATLERAIAQVRGSA